MEDTIWNKYVRKEISAMENKHLLREIESLTRLVSSLDVKINEMTDKLKAYKEQEAAKCQKKKKKTSL